MRKEQSAKQRGGQKDCESLRKRRSGIEGGQRTSKQVKRSGEKQPAESPQRVAEQSMEADQAPTAETDPSGRGLSQSGA